jgi:hypothetical protein
MHKSPNCGCREVCQPSSSYDLSSIPIIDYYGGTQDPEYVSDPIPPMPSYDALKKLLSIYLVQKVLGVYTLLAIMQLFWTYAIVVLLVVLLYSTISTYNHIL